MDTRFGELFGFTTLDVLRASPNKIVLETTVFVSMVERTSPFPKIGSREPPRLMVDSICSCHFLVNPVIHRWFTALTLGEYRTRYGSQNSWFSTNHDSFCGYIGTPILTQPMFHQLTLRILLSCSQVPVPSQSSLQLGDGPPVSGHRITTRF